MSGSDHLARLIVGGGPLLLDFDGPICSIFAGYPAPQVASGLIALLRQKGLDLPDRIDGATDPLEVLRWVGTVDIPQLTAATEDALCAAELQAVATAQPTPYAREVIVAAHQTGLPVAIVSNNSADAVATYLSIHRLDRYVYPIIGRAYANPAQMKPNPKPILSAAHALSADPSSCVLVGDSLSDIEGAKAAGVHVIGYANKSAKLDEFRSSEADEVITSMAEIARILADQPIV
jgi:HAD superfamily hydrolase (TIGR01509 family)